MRAEAVVEAFAAALLGGLFLYHIRKAVTSDRRSRRWASAALACGWPALAGGLYRAVGVPAENPDVFRPIGIVHLVLAAVGFVSLSAAVMLRKRDGGARRLALAGAGVLMLLNAGVGGLIVLHTSAPYRAAELAGSGDPVTVRRIDGHGLEVTLPGAGWQMKSRSQGVADFYHQNPQMLAGVVSVEPDTTAARFEAVIAHYQRVSREDLSARSVIREGRGESEFGHPMWIDLCEESENGERLLVGVSVTWLSRAKVVVLLFEGHYRARSEIGIWSERAVFRASAEQFLRSAR